MGRSRLERKMEESVNTIVQSKLGGAKAALRAETLEKLTKDLFTQEKTKGADQLKEDTQGMSAANAAAVELSRNNQYQFQAEQDAAQQVDVEMKSGLEEQLEKNLLQQERAAASQNLERDIQAEVEAEAHQIAKRALDQKYRDDMDAMEVGQTHAAALGHGGGSGGEMNAPNVVDAAAAASSMSGAAAALLANDAQNSADSDQQMGVTPQMLAGMNSTEATPAPTIAPNDIPDALENVTNSSNTNMTNATEESPIRAVEMIRDNDELELV